VTVGLGSGRGGGESSKLKVISGVVATCELRFAASLLPLPLSLLLPFPRASSPVAAPTTSLSLSSLSPEKGPVYVGPDSIEAWKGPDSHSECNSRPKIDQAS
jgi:hypothetical protein